ncbi:MAG: hydroxymethylglutaryl-CoA lyase [Pseudomonadales bacterium]|jgi:hydroxymethylglutaryl-CoA lyase
MSLPTHVKIVEVGPRDGLQNEAVDVPAKVKVALINQLVDAGISYIEAGSFVNPKWVPQMANSEDVFTQLVHGDNITYAALTPNLKGFERALSVNATEVAIFAAASEAFSQKNINCSIAESIARFEPVMAAAKQANIKVRGYVSCVLGCPYQKDVPVSDVVKVSTQLFDMGCYEISLGDTIGTGTPIKVKELIAELSQVIPVEKLAVHFHDTYGQALANIYAALECGVAVVDSSISGLGGCPYAKGASGNVASEDLVYMLNGMGIEHGVDLDKLILAGNKISDFLQRDSGSKVALANHQ